MPWRGWESLGGPTGYAPTISSWGPGRLDVFIARGFPSGPMLHQWFNNGRWTGTWEDLGGILTQAPAAVSRKFNYIDTFARGTDNQLYTKFWNGSGWVDWARIGAVTMTSAPVAASWGADRLDVFALGDRDLVTHFWWNEGGAWSSENLGGPFQAGLPPAATSREPNHIDLFAKVQQPLPEGNLWYRNYGYDRPGAWSSSWIDQGLGTGPWGPAVVAQGPNRLDLLTIGNDQALWQNTWNSGSPWSGWQRIGRPPSGVLLTGPPAAVSWAPGRIDVVARGTDDGVWHTWFE